MSRRLTLPAPIAVAAALLASMAVSAGASAQPIPANFDSSAVHGNEAEDAIAVNPTNPANVVTTSTLPDVVSGLFEGVSTDGGQTWTRQVIGTGAPLGEICCDQQLAWDRFGNLWMTYLVNTNGNVFVAVSTNGGLTFSKVAEIVPTTPTGSRAPSGATPKRLRPPSNNPNISGDQPSISVGRSSVWVSYTSFPSTVVQAFGASVTGLGTFGSFSAPESVPTSAGRGDFGDTAVGPSGQVMVTYQDQTNGQGGSHIYIAVDQSTGDLAVSWYDCRKDLGAGGPGDTDGIPNDDAQIWATDSTDGGVTFAPNFQVSTGTFNAPDAQSSFDYGDYTHAAFQSHRFYPAWSDNSNSTGQNPDGALHQLDLFTAKVVIP